MYTCSSPENCGLYSFILLFFLRPNNKKFHVLGDRTLIRGNCHIHEHSIHNISSIYILNGIFVSATTPCERDMSPQPIANVDTETVNLDDDTTGKDFGVLITVGPIVNVIKLPDVTVLDKVQGDEVIELRVLNTYTFRPFLIISRYMFVY